MDTAADQPCEMDPIQTRDAIDRIRVVVICRLDERDALVRIERTRRGRFRVDVDATLRLEAVEV